MNHIAIHESENSDKVVKFKPYTDFKRHIVDMYENGNIDGFYYGAEGEIFVKDIWGEVHENVTTFGQVKID